MGVLKSIYFGIVLIIGKIILKLTAIMPGVSGTTWPGGIAGMLKKNILSSFKYGDNTRVIVVTGTGGKTTTTGMISQLVKSSGKSICTNVEGANMYRGVATAFIGSSKLSGRINADYIVLEVDERYLAMVCREVKPQILVVNNILKDQSQRNGEPGVILGKISSAINDSMLLVLNGDDPNVASLGKGRKNVRYFGVENQKGEGIETGVPAVSSPCPVCGGAIEFEYDNLLNIGKFKCGKCGLMADQTVNRVSFDKATGILSFMDKNYKAKFFTTDFMYCYSAMLTVADAEGIDSQSIQKSIDAFKLPEGRVEVLKVGDKKINYLRIKQETPVTLQSALNVVARDRKPKIVVFDLSEVVDFTPNYTGMYYAYDCNFGDLPHNNVQRYICMSKVICYDTATRLVLEGVSKDDITVLPTADYTQLLNELEKYDCKNVYLLTWMHSYYDCVNSIEKYEKRMEQ